LAKPRRTIVVGNTCAGKSTFAAALAAHLSVPSVDLDALYWQPNWQPTERETFRHRVDVATSGPGWVLAGNYESQRDVSWPRAEAVVWLDLPLPRILARVVKRTVKRWWTGEVLWGTNRERGFDHLKLWDEHSSLVTWAIRHHEPRRRQMRTAMRDARWRHLEFLRFPSTELAYAWLARL
jgi:adenylate kinase family enzyme